LSNAAAKTTGLAVYPSMQCRVARKCNQLAARPRPAACRISSRRRSSSCWH